MKPVGLEEARLGRKKLAAAQMVDKTLDHPFVGNHQKVVSGISIGGFHQCLLTSFQNTVAGFSPGRTKIPAGVYLFFQNLVCLRLNLWDGFAYPITPILFSEPGISFQWDIQKCIDPLSSSQGPAAIASQ